MLGNNNGCMRGGNSTERFRTPRHVRREAGHMWSPGWRELERGPSDLIGRPQNQHLLPFTKPGRYRGDWPDMALLSVNAFGTWEMGTQCCEEGQTYVPKPAASSLLSLNALRWTRRYRSLTPIVCTASV